MDINILTVFILAIFVGIEIISKVPPTLHTPLMSGSNAISGIAIVGAILFTKAADKFGNILVLAIAIASWSIICGYAYFITTPIQFYLIAGFVGLLMGGTQTIARATYSLFIPPESKDTTSFFSFYDVTEKIGIVIGMVLYGLAAQITGNVRFSVLIFMFFFLLGAILLLRVPKVKV